MDVLLEFFSHKGALAEISGSEMKTFPKSFKTVVEKRQLLGLDFVVGKSSFERQSIFCQCKDKDAYELHNANKLSDFTLLVLAVHCFRL